MNGSTHWNQNRKGCRPRRPTNNCHIRDQTRRVCHGYPWITVNQQVAPLSYQLRRERNRFEPVNHHTFDFYYLVWNSKLLNNKQLCNDNQKTVNGVAYLKASPICNHLLEEALPLARGGEGFSSATRKTVLLHSID